MLTSSKETQILKLQLVKTQVYAIAEHGAHLAVDGDRNTHPNSIKD